MALISCPECRREISEDAVSCPNCGFPLAKISGSAGDVVVVRRGFALAAVILATGYLVFSALFYIGNFAPYTGISWLGDMFANSLYIHVVLLVVGVIFGWSGFLTQRRNQVLTKRDPVLRGRRILSALAAFPGAAHRVWLCRLCQDAAHPRPCRR